MKTKDIFDVFGIAPSTLSDWSKEDNKKHTLAKLLKNMSMDDVKDILSKELKSQSKPVMLLSTVNCSIGNKKKHFTLTGLKNLFYKKEPLDVYDKYALKTIKNEALEEEIVDFRNYYRISPKRVETVLALL
ncbi:hypothetical protein GJV85_13430 (plasmid) [Sulfurimonas aquatica]|uniref:Uncharacterized protein n=1 Tax=Sulfurimonas aquatica TaxID=2672570 RepID=A0A975B2R8_9BACT|nr:hypothetical protein [Sulfurimonas aquatica]QSZ43172.1 hypothetical protein GJV85_13430 [Sulfurimonas aquatica]